MVKIKLTFSYNLMFASLFFYLDNCAPSIESLMSFRSKRKRICIASNRAPWGSIFSNLQKPGALLVGGGLK